MFYALVGSNKVNETFVLVLPFDRKLQLLKKSYYCCLNCALIPDLCG